MAVVVKEENGEAVRWRHGGPVMHALGTLSNGDVRCGWFSRGNGAYLERDFRAEDLLLEPVEDLLPEPVEDLLLECDPPIIVANPAAALSPCPLCGSMPPNGLIEISGAIPAKHRQEVEFSMNWTGPSAATPRSA